MILSSFLPPWLVELGVLLSSTRPLSLVRGLALLVCLTWVPLRAEESAQGNSLPEPLSLEAAIAALDADHPQILSSRVAEQRARAALDAETAGDLPRLRLEAAYRYMDPYVSDEDGLVKDHLARLVLRQKITDFGQSSARETARSLELEAAGLALLEARQHQLLEVLEGFFDGLVADLAFGEANEAMSIAFIRYDKGQDRHELGQLSDLDLLQLENGFQTARQAFLGAQAEQRASRSRLALALNRPNQLPSVLLPPQLAERERPAFDELLQQVLDGAPRIALARARLEAARAALSAVERDWRPELRGEIEGARYYREIGSRNGPFTASLILQMDLFDPARDSRLAEARARVLDAQAAVSQAELELRDRVTRLWLDLELHAARVQQMRVSSNYQELYLDRSRALYEQEVTTDLGDAQTRSSRLRKDAARASYDLALTWARLHALRGDLFESTPLLFVQGDNP